MTRKALLADGTRPGLPLLPRAMLRELVYDGRKREWMVRRGRAQRDGWSVAYIGLGRDLCGATLEQLASELGCSVTWTRRIDALHRAELSEPTAYATAVIELARHGIERFEGAEPLALDGGVRR